MLRGKVLLAVVAVVVVAVAGVVALVVLSGDDSDAPASKPSATSSSTPTDESTAHEHDQVDTVDPNIDPADYQDFCNAFYVFANAYSVAVSDGDPSESMQLASAADDFRAVADQTDLTDEVRRGLDWFIDDAMRIENDVSVEDQNAWSTFLNSACPA